MGRAFPELQMGAADAVRGHRYPDVDSPTRRGNVGVLNTIDNHWSESLARALTITMGCSAIISNYAMTGAQARGVAGRRHAQPVAARWAGGSRRFAR